MGDFAHPWNFEARHCGICQGKQAQLIPLAPPPTMAPEMLGGVAGGLHPHLPVQGRP